MIKPNPPETIARSYIAVIARVLVLAAFIVTATQSSVMAANWRNMEVYNNTGYTIQRLYITAKEQRNWGEDLLGSSVLYNGGHTSFRYDANYQYYELRIIFSNGSEYTWTGDRALNFYRSTMIVFSNNGNGTFRAKVD